MRPARSELGLSLSGVAYAADLFVATTGVDAGDCTDSMSPCLTIQYAVDVAAPSGDTIYVAAGTYVENVTVDRDISIEGAGLGTTTVDGNGAGQVVVVWPDIDVILMGMTITNGLSDNGGGIENEGNLTVDSCRVR